MSVMLIVAAFAAAYGGMAVLALAQPAHWGAVTHRPASSPAERRRRRCLGVVLLMLVVGLAIKRDGVSFGLLLAPLLWATGAAATVATLTVRPRILRPLAYGSSSAMAIFRRFQIGK